MPRKPTSFERAAAELLVLKPRMDEEVYRDAVEVVARIFGARDSNFYAPKFREACGLEERKVTR